MMRNCCEHNLIEMTCMFVCERDMALDFDGLEIKVGVKSCEDMATYEERILKMKYCVY